MILMLLDDDYFRFAGYFAAAARVIICHYAAIAARYTWRNARHSQPPAFHFLSPPLPSLRRRYAVYAYRH